MKIPILGTGLSGLVGSRIVELLQDKFDFTDLSLATGVDITDFTSLKKPFETSKAKVVLHMAAKTDVDSCEDDKLLADEGQAFRVNVIGTQNIVDLAKKTGKRVIYISTDFVFDGVKKSYSEEDEPNPVNWYGYTKWQGEKEVKSLEPNFCIVRIAYPYRASFADKKDFVRASIAKIKQSGKIFGLTDHIFTPTFIDDIASALAVILQKDINGIFHVVGSQSLTPLAAIEAISRIFNLSGRIRPIERKTYFGDRAYRPFKLALKNDRIKKLGISMRGFNEGLVEIKRQMEDFIFL